MGAATAGASVLTAVTGLITTLNEAKNKKKIAREIANQKEVPLTNIADSMQVSTMGSDLQKQQQAQLAASQTSALQDAGSRALIGGLGAVTAQNQDLNSKIGAGLDEQVTNISNLRAQDEQRIQSIKEQRANAKLAALSSQYGAASQNQAQGMANIIQGAGIAGNAIANASSNKEKDPKSLKNTSASIRGAAYRQFGG
jgi:hypothetical protein